MKSPDIFIPKQRLELPLDSDFETDVMLMAECPMTWAGFSASAVMRMHFPLSPHWEEWSDGRGGILHIVDRDGEKVPFGREDVPSGRPTNPNNTDGLIVYEDTPAVITCCAASREDDVRKVLWGVSTHLFDSLLTDDNRTYLESIHLYEEGWHQFFDRCYPPQK